MNVNVHSIYIHIVHKFRSSTFYFGPKYKNVELEVSLSFLKNLNKIDAHFNDVTMF